MEDVAREPSPKGIGKKEAGNLRGMGAKLVERGVRTAWLGQRYAIAYRHLRRGEGVAFHFQTASHSLKTNHPHPTPGVGGGRSFWPVGPKWLLDNEFCDPHNIPSAFGHIWWPL